MEYREGIRHLIGEQIRDAIRDQADAVREQTKVLLELASARETRVVKVTVHTAPVGGHTLGAIRTDHLRQRVLGMEASGRGRIVVEGADATDSWSEIPFDDLPFVVGPSCYALELPIVEHALVRGAIEATPLKARFGDGAEVYTPTLSDRDKHLAGWAQPRTLVSVVALGMPDDVPDGSTWIVRCAPRTGSPDQWGWRDWRRIS